MVKITSAQNPIVKFAKKLCDRRTREKSQYFLIEGYRELLRAIDADFPIEKLFIAPELFLGSNEEGLIHRLIKKGCDILEVPGSLFETLSYRDRPDGLLGIAKEQHLTLHDLPEKKNPFFVVAEAIEKPGNLGTILRSSDAVGVDGVIVCDRCTDIYNPNVVRASTGTLFTQPVVEADGEETLEWLKSREIQIVATTPAADLDYTEADLSGKVAIVVGTEQVGLTSRWLEGADVKVRIPMRGQADSLNVAVATTLLLYEVLRQRKK